MNFNEITIKVRLKKNLDIKYMNEEISKVINKSMLMDEKLKEFHHKKGFKYYVFSGLYPANKKEGYKAGKIYSFKFRSLDQCLVLKLKYLIPKTNNDLFEVLFVYSETKEYLHRIKQIYSVTPCISVIDKGKHWTYNDFSIELLKRKINLNIQKKYKDWFNEPVDETHDFIESIEQINKNVIFLRYKNGPMLTNKFKINIKEDELSQKFAFMILATGLLEKGSLGFGFCTIGREESDN